MLVGQVGAVSRGLAGEELAELRELVDTGVVAFSDDGRPVNDSDLLLQALRYLRGTGRPILLHLEDRTLSVDGAMHEGRWSARLGLKGIPRGRRIRPHGARSGGASRTCTARRWRPVAVPARRALHFQHLSTAAAVRLLREAKAEGLPVTGEATPHHLLLTDERVKTHDPNFKMNPPLRSEADREALVAALAEGLIDCVATDHAPARPTGEGRGPVRGGQLRHHRAGDRLRRAVRRAGGAWAAEPGAAGRGHVHGAVPLCVELEAPRLEAGAPADFCVVDLDEEWTVTVADLKGKGRNCAFLGERVRGRVLLTVVRGATRFAPAAPGGGAARERRENGVSDV